MKNVSRIKHIKLKLFAFSGYLLVVILFAHLHIPCVFRHFFGVSCPGCGMTRAYISLLHFDFKNAFIFNYMFWSVPIILLYILFDGRLFKNMAINNSGLILIAIGFLTLFILRCFGILSV